MREFFSDVAIFTSNRVYKKCQKINFWIFSQTISRWKIKPTYIFIFLIDRVYIKRTLMKEFFSNPAVEKFSVSDYDTLRIVIEKNVVAFHTVDTSV